MTGKLPPSASVAQKLGGEKLHAPAAERNAQVLCDLLVAQAPDTGSALEIASGTGQHVVAFAHALPRLIWHPSDIDPARRSSINAYVRDAGMANLRDAAPLDACQPGWGAQHAPKDLVVLVNLLHLISGDHARIVVREAMEALARAGRFVIYGPFMRAGQLTSVGDARFHADLCRADPAIGYKNDAEVDAWLREAGAQSVTRLDMPANNLAFVATR